jgi:CubicO group peptidase (beta-lactamase class C family)
MDIKGLMRAMFATVVILRVGSLAASPVAADGPPWASARFQEADRRTRLVAALPAIESAIRRRMANEGTPGLAYGVIIDGEPVAFGGLGVRDVASKAPLDADTILPIASLTKSFVALAALQLRDAGQLRLDDPVTRYLPALGRWLGTTQDAGPVTVRHLLNGMSGLPEDGMWNELPLAGLPQATFTSWLKDGLPLSQAPGAGFQYSNYAFALLGRVIERTSGRSYEDHIRLEILAPLSLTSTWWTAKEVPASRVSTGYRKVEGGVESEAPFDFPGPFGATGGLFSSARDVARWIGMFLQAYPPRDGAEAAPAARSTIREMQSGGAPPQLIVVQPPNGAAVQRAIAYGNGLFAVHDCQWGREVYHPGEFAGFTSHMRWLPDRGVGVFVIANLAQASASAYTREAVELLHATGALQPRVQQPGKSLLSLAEQVTALANRWDDAQASAIGTESLWQQAPLATRRQQWTDLHAKVGACRVESLRATTAMKGDLLLACQRGALEIHLALAPTPVPRLQVWEVKERSVEKQESVYRPTCAP